MSRDKSDSQIIGTDYIPLRIRVERSKLGTGWVDLNTYALQGVGIDREAELVDYAEEFGVIEKKGSWYSYTDKDGEKQTIGQGIESAREWVIENEELILKTLKDEFHSTKKEITETN